MELFKRSGIDGSLDIKGDLEQIAKATSRELLIENIGNTSFPKNAMDQPIEYRRNNMGDVYLGPSLTSEVIINNGLNVQYPDIPEHAEKLIRAIAAKLSDDELMPYMYNDIVGPIYEERVKDHMKGAHAVAPPDRSRSRTLADMYPFDYI